MAFGNSLHCVSITLGQTCAFVVLVDSLMRQTVHWAALQGRRWDGALAHLKLLPCRPASARSPLYADSHY